MAKRKPENLNFAQFHFPTELSAQIQAVYKIPTTAIKRLEQAVVGAVRKEVYGSRPHSYISTGGGGAIFDIQGMDVMQIASIDQAVQQKITEWMIFNMPTDYESATEAEIDKERALLNRYAGARLTSQISGLVTKEFKVPSSNTQTRRFLDTELKRAVGRKRDVIISRDDTGVSVMYPKGTFTGDITSVQKNGKSRRMSDELRNIDQRVQTRIKAETNEINQIGLNKEAAKVRRAEELEQQIYNRSQADEESAVLQEQRQLDQDARKERKSEELDQRIYNEATKYAETQDNLNIQKDRRSEELDQRIYNTAQKDEERNRSRVQREQDKGAGKERRSEELDQRIYNESVKQAEIRQQRIAEDDLITQYLGVPVDPTWSNRERSQRLTEARSVEQMVKDPMFIMNHRVNSLERQALNNSATYSYYTDESSPGYNTREGARYRRRLQREEDAEDLEGSGRIGKTLYNLGMSAEKAGNAGRAVGTAGTVAGVIIAIGTMVKVVVATLGKILTEMLKIAQASLKDQQQGQLMNINTSDARWLTNLERTRPDLSLRSSVTKVAEGTASILSGSALSGEAFARAAPLLATSGYGSIEQIVSDTVTGNKDAAALTAQIFGTGLIESLRGYSVVAGGGQTPSDAAMANAQELSGLIDGNILKAWVNELTHAGASIPELIAQLDTGLREGTTVDVLKEFSNRFGVAGIPASPPGQQDALADAYRNMQSASALWLETVTNLKNQLTLQLQGPLTELQDRIRGTVSWFSRLMGIDTSDTDKARDDQLVKRYREEAENLSQNISGADFQQRMMLQSANIPLTVLENIRSGRITPETNVSWPSSMSEEQVTKANSLLPTLFTLERVRESAQKELGDREKVLSQLGSYELGKVPMISGITSAQLYEDARSSVAVEMDRTVRNRVESTLSGMEYRPVPGEAPIPVGATQINAVTGREEAAGRTDISRIDVRRLQEQAMDSSKLGYIESQVMTRYLEQLSPAQQEAVQIGLLSNMGQLSFSGSSENREITGIFRLYDQQGRERADPITMIINSPDTGVAPFKVGVDPAVIQNRDSRQTGVKQKPVFTGTTRSSALGGSQ